MSTTLNKKDGVLPGLMLTGVLFEALYKGIEGEYLEEMYFTYKEISRAVGVKKPQRAKSLSGK